MRRSTRSRSCVASDKAMNAAASLFEECDECDGTGEGDGLDVCDWCEGSMQTYWAELRQQLDAAAVVAAAAGAAVAAAAGVAAGYAARVASLADTDEALQQSSFDLLDRMIAVTGVA